MQIPSLALHGDNMFDDLNYGDNIIVEWNGFSWNGEFMELSENYIIVEVFEKGNKFMNHKYAIGRLMAFPKQTSLCKKGY